VVKNVELIEVTLDQLGGEEPCGEIFQPINSANESRAFRHTCRSGFDRDWRWIATPSLGADLSARIKSARQNEEIELPGM